MASIGTVPTGDVQAPVPKAWQRAIRTALRVIDAAVDLVGFILLTAIVVIIILGVVARYVFNSSFPWTEELATWTFVWLTFVGVAAGHRENRHINIGLVESFFGPAGQRLLKAVVAMIVAYTTAMLFAGSVGVIDRIGGLSSALQWPSYVKFLMIPASCVISLVYLVFRRMTDEPRSFLAAATPIVIGVLFCVVDGAGYLDMPGTNASVLMTIAIAAALVLGVPIGYAMLFSVFVSNWGEGVLPTMSAVLSMVSGESSFLLLAVPLFLTTGYLMNASGLSMRIIDFASALVGHWRGGLAQANVVHSVMLGGICGSVSADAASTTMILVPEMVKRGYSAPFSCAVTAVGSILPACFPPSIALLIYASVAQVSVAQLFTAGIVPGLLMAAAMIVTVHFIATRRGYEVSGQRASLRQIGVAGWRALPAFILALGILGLLRFGVMTATEAGVVAVLWSLFLGTVVYRQIGLRQYYRMISECAVDSALIGFLVAVAVPFAQVLIADQIPQIVATWASVNVTSTWGLLLLLNVTLFIAGACFDIIPIILIFVPLFVPILVASGADPIHLGVVIVIGGILGALTPPVGVLVFISASIARVSSWAVFRECNPFLVACYGMLLVITAFPALSLTLWRLIGH